MCIAIVKQKNARIPNREILSNCFVSNPHGAGYMYIDNGYLHIKKGFMTFNDFYSSFSNEHFTKDDTLFIHFRIATHGLVDGGNTHPFPVTQNVELLRKQNIKFKGYGIMHNGVFSNIKYNSDNICSDTMVFTKFLAQSFLKENNSTNNFLEDQIVSNIKNNYPKISSINYNVGYNKIAIMNSNGKIKMFGNWIENDGSYYSNQNYKLFNSEDDYYDICSVCNKKLEDDYIEKEGYCFCQECYDRFVNKNSSVESQFFICKECGRSVFHYFSSDNDTKVCQDCVDIG